MLAENIKCADHFMCAMNKKCAEIIKSAVNNKCAKDSKCADVIYSPNISSVLLMISVLRAPSVLVKNARRK